MLVFDKDTILVLIDAESSRDKMHNDVNALNTTELYFLSPSGLQRKAYTFTFPQVYF